MHSYRARYWFAKIIFIIMVLPIAAASGQQKSAPFESGRPSSWNHGDFAADLVITDRHEAFLKQWSSAKENPDRWPQLHVADRTQKHRPVHALIVFRGCPGADGTPCSMTLDYEVRRPDGSEYGTVKGRRLWNDSDAPPDGSLFYLGGPYLEFIADEGDPLGQYEFTAKIRSPMANSEIVLKRFLVVVENIEDSGLP